MISLRSLTTRTARGRVCSRTIQMLTPQRAFTAPTFLPQTSSTPQTPTVHIRHASVLYNTLQNRSYGTKTAADEIIEEIQEQYGTARDEFEIASEETEKKTVYAADDRAAAREELEALKKMYEDALEGPEGEEVKRRVGQRIRELDNAVGAMEKSALEE